VTLLIDIETTGATRSEDDLAGIRNLEPCKHSQESGLADAVGSYDTETGAGTDCERNLSEHRFGAAVEIHSRTYERRLHGRPHTGIGKTGIGGT
jgi:hypothetical protein